MKQTEIGLIPDDWEVKEIKDFADVTTGDKNTQDAEENGKYPFYVRSPIVEKINKFSYDTEGVITAGDGVGTGKVFHYAKRKFGLHQRAYLIYNFKNTDPKYFYYNFSKNFYERVHSMTAKSSVDSVRREMITKMLIPIPPTLAEQQRIAKALSDVDALISTTEKLIQKKKNIKQGTMQNLLTGKKRLPGFGPQTKSPAYKQTELGLIPEDWKVKSLGDVVTFLDRKRIPITESERKKGIYPYYGASGIIDYVNNYIFDGNYVLLGEDGANIIDRSSRLAFVVHGKCWINNHAHVLLPNENMNLDFLSEYLESLDYTSYNTGTAQPKLNREKCNSIPIVTPSFAEQTAIANVLFCMDKEIETLKAKLEKYRNLKTAMMQQLLTGKIRLV
ncbi:restriction endonuclease subunit S [uncultured Treponema sp.]|uniref:restriction endonuclease subunit S n=1 Tax=uncultured Treponema sp. TaxID=162155 RepID=UPI0025CB9C45|nr:restriction endonuclease subunit S [uncultured Treponema sp.]